MKIKTMVAIYECPSCGSTVETERDILIDKYLDKKIELPKVEICQCGRRGSFKLINIKIEDKSNHD